MDMIFRFSTLKLLENNWNISDPTQKFFLFTCVKCVASLIICCNPYVEVIPSIVEPSYVILSPWNQKYDLALKLPRTTVKKAGLNELKIDFGEWNPN